MIVELRVRDLATIADVTLRLEPGLTALTGETGAGKSLVVDALSLLLGARADSSAVRPGAARTVVEGAFERLPAGVREQLEALGLDDADDRLVVRREVSAEGRSRAWVNGSPATVSALAELGGLLVDLHGQHDALSLLRPDAQRDILDRFGDAMAERAAVADAHAALAAIRAEEEALVQRRDDVRRRADYLRHVVGEIDAARVVVGELAALDAESRRLGHAESLREAARTVAGAVGEGGAALEALQRAERALAVLERTDPDTAGWRELLDGAWANLNELERLAASYADDLQADPSRLDAVERRRDQLARLQQKHGATEEAILATRREAGAELDLLDVAELDLRGLAARRVAAEGALAAAAQALTTRRHAAAERLARAVGRVLPGLGLPGAAFEAVFEPAAEVGVHGAERVAFHARLNAGMEARPVARAASGGELSRLMLALRVVLAQDDGIPTVVFDEVDQGIGGEVGSQVAAALAQVAGGRQVVVITHLPQIAARADRHLVVSKSPRRGLAASDVAPVLGEDRVLEVARMLGDADSAVAARHALEMLNQSPPPARPRRGARGKA